VLLPEIWTVVLDPIETVVDTVAASQDWHDFLHRVSIIGFVEHSPSNARCAQSQSKSSHVSLQYPHETGHLVSINTAFSGLSSQYPISDHLLQLLNISMHFPRHVVSTLGVVGIGFGGVDADSCMVEFDEGVGGAGVVAD